MSDPLLTLLAKRKIKRGSVEHADAYELGLRIKELGIQLGWRLWEAAMTGTDYVQGVLDRMAAYDVRVPPELYERIKELKDAIERRDTILATEKFDDLKRSLVNFLWKI